MAVDVMQIIQSEQMEIRLSVYEVFRLTAAAKTTLTLGGDDVRQSVAPVTEKVDAQIAAELHRLARKVLGVDDDQGLPDEWSAIITEQENR